jgi:two-component system phosphate regulon sensor histidine kinase PhoR
MVSERWLPSFVNRLALQIALAVTGGGTGLVWGLTAAGIGPSTGAGAACGLVAYAATHLAVHRRLRHATTALRQIRQHAFDDLTPPATRSADELGTLIREIYRTGQKLENEIQELKAMESYRREFIGNVSHELKTPIFSAQGFTETLLDGALTDEAVNRTFLEKILHNINRLETLAHDLSAITKIETGEMEMATQRIEVAELFDDVVDSLELKADQKNVSLQRQPATDLPAVYGDRDRIRRVLVNLADNAIKYNEAGGTVALHATSPSAGEVEFRVVDDGIGIPNEHLPRLTERFYRVDKSRSRNQGGSGLGLAIVKHILGAHDRTLHVESTPGEGSTFRFTLPTDPQSSLSTA